MDVSDRDQEMLLSEDSEYEEPNPLEDVMFELPS